MAEGIKPLDAHHVACAEKAKVDYFCTCDDGLLKKSKNLSLSIKMVNPVQLIYEFEK